MSHFTETGFWRTTKPHESDQYTLGAAPSINGNRSIQALRRKLIHLQAWPEEGDTFLELLAQAQGYGVTLMPSDYDWLPQVAEAAYKGNDIGSRYPSIFQKLLTYPDLREKFLQALQIRSLDS